MNEYKPNSHKYHAEQKTENSVGEKRAKQVVRGTVRPKKKNELVKFAETFIAEDVSNVGNYIWKDLIVPTIQKTIVNIVTDTANMVFLGKSGRTSAGNQSSGSKVSYRSYYDEPKRAEIPKATNRFDFEELEFSSRGEAEAVRVELSRIVNRYGYARVADMYDLAGLVPPVASYKYGWTDVSSADVRRWNDSYIVKLPSAMPID